MSDARWVALAEVARPHGVRGELRLRVYNSDSRLLPSQRKVLVRTAAGLESVMEFESVRGADSGYLLAKFRDVDDRDRADQLRGAILSVKREAFPALDEGEFYVCDVVGAKLVATTGEIGVVEDLVSYPTADALVVRLYARPDQHLELPLVEDFIERVELADSRIWVRDEAVGFLSGDP